jgi:DNA-binding CsgD family transcriptional regulator
VRVAAERVSQLTDKQRVLLEAVYAAPTVLEASLRLAMSRSNIYSSLRRISRKLGIATVPELLDLLRSGLLLPASPHEE